MSSWFDALFKYTSKNKDLNRPLQKIFHCGCVDDDVYHKIDESLIRMQY